VLNALPPEGAISTGQSIRLDPIVLSLNDARIRAGVPDGPATRYRPNDAWLLETPTSTALVTAERTVFVAGRARPLAAALLDRDSVQVRFEIPARIADPLDLARRFQSRGFLAAAPFAPSKGLNQRIAMVIVHRNELSAFLEDVESLGYAIDGLRVIPAPR
jgi:hypothetical protein